MSKKKIVVCAATGSHGAVVNSLLKREVMSGDNFTVAQETALKVLIDETGDRKRGINGLRL